MNIEELLNPISEKSICGEYLCYDYVYDQIKELRREDDAQLSQGIWQTEPKKANWPKVKSLCIDLLKTKTKDLQIAMWLMEALIAEYGFKGLNEGLSLIYKLSETFWDEIFPSIDWENHSYTYRLAPFFFLADKISERIVLIPITSKENIITYSLSDWMSARRNLQIKNHKGLSLRDIGKQIAATPIEIFEEIHKQVITSLELLKKIRDFLDNKCPQESPSFKVLMDNLVDIQHITEKNIELKNKQGTRHVEKSNVSAPSNEEDKILEAGVAPETSDNSDEPTLEQAYNALKEIAVFLENKQPQSPASTLVRIAFEIGKKSFQELLELNMKSGAPVLNTISELYKILKPQEENIPPIPKDLAPPVK